MNPEPYSSPSPLDSPAWQAIRADRARLLHVAATLQAMAAEKYAMVYWLRPHWVKGAERGPANEQTKLLLAMWQADAAALSRLARVALGVEPMEGL